MTNHSDNKSPDGKNRLDLVMLMLSLVWIALLVIELLRGTSLLLDILTYSIWAVFIIEFFTRLILARNRRLYLRQNWLSAIALVLPAMRALTIFRLLRLARSLRLVRLTWRLHRGIRALRLGMAARHTGYVIITSTIVIFAGAAGMYAFEKEAPAGPGFSSYGDALWWTAMLLTTIGSGYWPVTAEGRILCLLLSMYTFGVFGYFTAILASVFVGQQRRESDRRPRVQPPSS